MIQHNDPSFLIAPPQLLVGLSMDKRLMNQVSEKVTQIGYGGGPLPEAAGVLLSQHFRVFPIYGTSEMGLVSKISQSSSWDSDGWRGLTPHPRDNLQFRHLKGDLYEGVVVRNDDGKETQAVFKLFPELKEWSTKDIFTPDPKRKGHWIYQSRVDDVIILSDGGTVNPLGFEQQLMKAPFISQALLAGSGKSKTALLVEPQEQLEDMLERLWEKVQECNAIFPPQATVSKSHIIVVDPARPLPKAGKGNVQRMPAYQLYRQEIDALY